MSSSALLAFENPHFTVFGINIYYYAVIIVAGIIVATVVVGILFKHRNIPVDWTMDLLLCILPLGIIGARTFYCLTDPDVSMAEWFTSFRDGGLSILGGVIGGAIGVVLFSLIHKISFFRTADCLVPGLIIAQSIGRWGNFVNQEVFGHAVENPDLWWFPLAVYIDNGRVPEGWYYAFFFYESMLNLFMFGVLFFFMWKYTKKPSGLGLCAYLVWYGVVRSIMEPLRHESFQLGSEVAVSKVAAIIMMIIGIVAAICLLLWNYKKHGKFFGAAEGEPSAILPVYYTREQRRKMEEDRLAKLKAAEPENSAAETAEDAAEPENSAAEAAEDAAQPENSAAEAAEDAAEPENSAAEATEGMAEPPAGVREEKSDPAADESTPGEQTCGTEKDGQ